MAISKTPKGIVRVSRDYYVKHEQSWIPPLEPMEWHDRLAGWVLVAGALSLIFIFVALFVWLVASIIGVI